MRVSGIRCQESGVRGENEDHLIPAFCLLLTTDCLLLAAHCPRRAAGPESGNCGLGHGRYSVGRTPTSQAVGGRGW